MVDKSLQNRNRLIFIFVLLALIIGIAYSGSMNASWHLDDDANILKNPSLHLTELTLQSIKSCLFDATPAGGTFRPVANVTFAFNWFFGKDRVLGYHLVNLAIHIMVSFVIFLVICRLFEAPNLKKIHQHDVLFVGVFASVFWALHPIQTQAVTYIVQRMTSLAALFYVVAIWSYVSGRLSTFFHRKCIWFFACLLTWIMALLTKQNTITLPLVLVLLEFTFFQDFDVIAVNLRYWIFMLSGILVLIGVIAFFLINGASAPYMGKYAIRPFTPMERFLTQFRVIAFYGYQLIYPIPKNFSITHDYILSLSLFEPLTTILAVIFILGIIGAAVWSITKGPVLKIIGFSILFFFVNHLVESTFLPLEMVFEHRNYLPTFFLFLPVAIGIKKTVSYYQKHNQPMYYFVIAAVCVFLTSLGISTYIRNMDWQTEKTLWRDAMEKAPLSSRPPHNLAWAYSTQERNYSTAINLYHHALNLYDESIGFESTIYFNLASIYFSAFQDYEKTIEYALKTLQTNPNHDRAAYLLARSLAATGQVDAAEKILERSMDASKTNPDNMHFYGLLCLNMARPEKALDTFRHCLALDPDNWLYLRDIGFAMLVLKHFDRADWFFRRAKSFNYHQPEILLGLATVKIKQGLLIEVKQNLELFIQAVGIANMESYWRNAIASPVGLPIPYQKIAPLLSAYLNKKASFYDQIQH